MRDPGTRQLALADWRFCEVPFLLDAAWAALERAAPQPSTAALALLLAPDLPASVWSDGEPDEQLARWRLFRALGRTHPVGFDTGAAADPRVWALEALLFLGEQITSRERGAWARADWPAEPGDPKLAALWGRALSAPATSLWGDKARWESLLLSDCAGAFRQVMSTRELPAGVARQALSDLREGLWFQLVGGPEGPGGFRDLAARVLETGPPGSIDALAGLLGDEAWGVATACAAARGTWPDTLALALPGLAGGAARAMSLRARLTGGLAEPLVDLHVWVRLLDTWNVEDGTDPVRSWNVVVQNRGRARGRLRALVAELPDEVLVAALARLDGLGARTAAAARRYAWDLAWELLARGFAWDWGRPIQPACRAPAAELLPIAPSERPALRCWVLLVLLKGRLEPLRRWVETGGTGDRDGTWGRLLSEELPEALRDPVARGQRAATYHRLRAWLADGLDELVSGLRPTLAALAVLPLGRGLRADTEALLGPGWDARVPFPKAGFPTFRAHAVAALAATQAAL